MTKFLPTRLGLILLAVCCLTPAIGVSADPPHIIVILTDDMGIGDLGCYGGTLAKTPHLDQMAAEGTRFTHYYSAAPICSPSRTAFITGAVPARWNITSFLQTRKGNRGCEQADYLDPAAPSLPRTLKSAGYATAHFGKWHLGGGRDVKDAPKFAAYGYDEHASTYESPEPHPDLTATDWIWSNKDPVKRWERTAFFVDKTLDFLKRHPDQPCYVNLWPDEVHTPWVPDEAAAKGDNKQNFLPVLVEYDRQIGRLLAGLKELKIDERTLVIFTSDNGPLPTFMGARTAGLRGSKLSLYEGGIRMPLLARWPGKVPAGRVDDETVLCATDLFPTFCELTGAKLPESSTFSGQNMLAALQGEVIQRAQPLLWEYGRNQEFFAYPKNEHDRSPTLAIRSQQWKLLANADGSGAELYDVVSDRAETKNLASEQPEITARLQQQLLAWKASLPKVPSLP